MPRAFSSGAASIWSYALASPPYNFASTVVIAAVSVVLPWSTWPIVPTFTWGLVRSNLLFAISNLLELRWCPWRGSNARPLPYQGSALPLSHMGTDRIRINTGLETKATKPVPTQHKLLEYNRTTGAGDGNRTRVISLEG